jgi:hypothetical protein
MYGRLKPALEPDVKWPGMWRVRWTDGRLSDMTNITRAKDAITCFLETVRRRGRGRQSQLEARPCAKAKRRQHD